MMGLALSLGVSTPKTVFHPLPRDAALNFSKPQFSRRHNVRLNSMMAQGPSDSDSLGPRHNFKTNGAQDISDQYSKGKYIWEMVG